jgi:hypothetical protein
VAKLSACLVDRRWVRTKGGRNRSDGNLARSKTKDRYSSQQQFNDPDLTNRQIYIEFLLTIEGLRQAPGSHLVQSQPVACRRSG